MDLLAGYGEQARAAEQAAQRQAAGLAGGANIEAAGLLAGYGEQARAAQCRARNFTSQLNATQQQAAEALVAGCTRPCCGLQTKQAINSRLPH